MEPAGTPDGPGQWTSRPMRWFRRGVETAVTSVRGEGGRRWGAGRDDAATGIFAGGTGGTQQSRPARGGWLSAAGEARREGANPFSAFLGTGFPAEMSSLSTKQRVERRRWEGRGRACTVPQWRWRSLSAAGGFGVLTTLRKRAYQGGSPPTWRRLVAV